MARVLIPPKFVGETRTDYVDFTPFLAAGQAISSATAVSSLYSGVDPTPTAVAGTASFSGFIVSVPCTGGVAGAIYQIVVTIVTTSPANTLQITYYLTVTTDLP